MDLQIRAARNADFPEIIKLLQLCFDEAAPGFFAAQTEHDSTFRLRHARVAVLDGRVAGYVRIFARRMRVAGAVVRVGGIGSVATHPDAQHRGIATALLEDAIAQMQRGQMAVSFLFTGIPGFYERLGYRIARQPVITVARQALRELASSSVETRRFDPGADLRSVLAIHRQATAEANGAIFRTRRTWSDALYWLEGHECRVAIDAGGGIAGYVRARCRPYGHQILEAECREGDVLALPALLRDLSARACACDVVVASVPGSHPVAALLRAMPGARETTDVQHPMMVRMLSDDPRVAAAFDHEEMYFWNSDRI